MGLCGDEPGMIRNLNHLDDPSVRGDAGQLHTVFRQGLAVIVVDLIAVAVTFVNRFLSVQLIGFGGFVQDAGIRTETQGSADILDAVLVRHQMDDRVAGVRIQFRGVGVTVTNDIAGKFHNGHLHSETQAEERDSMGASPADCGDFPFNPSASKAAGDEDAVDTVEDFGGVPVVYRLRVNPADRYAGMVCHPAVLQRFHNGDVGVMQGDVLADKSDRYLLLRVFPAFNHGAPFG